MQYYKLTNSRAVTISEIDNFENHYAAKLPDDYRDFLLRHNGIRVNAVLDVPDFGVSYIGTLYGIGVGESSSLETYQDIFNDTTRIPEKFFKFFSDANGNGGLMSLHKNSYGKIFFWDHEHEPHDPEKDWKSYGNIYLIANNFTEFLNMKLREDQ